MSHAAYDILGIGNAIMDVIAPVKDDFLTQNDIPKGGMALIDSERAIGLSALLAPLSPTEIAGGSGANTIAGAAMLGAKTAYIGVVADDDMGARFSAGMNASGVAYDTPAQAGGLPTARCLIAVTPDGERSMSTFLGASTQFTPDHLDMDKVKTAKIVYLEGYLFDSEPAKAAFISAAKTARMAGNKVALTLSDSFCVGRHKEAFKELVANHIDILFANEDEITALYDTTIDGAMAQLRSIKLIAAITRSEKGSVIIDGDQAHLIDAAPIGQLVDTTGAGDQYAAGFLAAFARGEDLRQCGTWGSACAAEVIQHYGARPEREITL